jgi:II/X family phage/plasmid replication protein
MFDTVAGILENGPYCPKDASRNSWEGMMRDYFDDTDNCRKTSVSQTLNRPEARILIYGDGGGIRIESSLPKLLYGNNLSSVSNAQPALKRLREFTLDYVSGDLPDLDEMRYTRVDYCHNFELGNLLPDYVATLSKVCYLTHRRTTNGSGGVEWWNGSRRVRVYDKYREILEREKKAVPIAKGTLRFEHQIRKQSGLLERRLKAESLQFSDVLTPALAYKSLEETLHKMCLDTVFLARDAARNVLDSAFSYQKATRLLGVIQRLMTGTIEEIKLLSSRSTFYADKRELRRLGLWPPSAVSVDLPGLRLPPLEQLLSDQIVLLPKSTTFIDCADSSARIESAA